MNDSIVILVLIASILSTIIGAYLLVCYYYKEQKRRFNDLKELDEKFENSLEGNSVDKILKVLLFFKTKNYSVKLSSKIISLIIILVFNTVVMIAAMGMENLSFRENEEIKSIVEQREEKIKKEGTDNFEKIKKMEFDVINSIKFYELISKVFFNYMLILSITFLAIYDKIDENSKNQLNNRVKEIIAELEYRLYELPKGKDQQNIIIKLPDSDSLPKDEKIPTFEKNLQISYVSKTTN